MEFSIESFDTDGFVRTVIETASKQMPYGTGKILTYVTDQVFFPNYQGDEKGEKEALWDKIEKSVSKMVNQNVESEVEKAFGKAAAVSIMGKLKNFGALFRELRYIHNSQEKAHQLEFLTVAANNLVPEMGNLPDHYLHEAAPLFKVIAAIHIATIMELKLLDPSNERRQASLNNMAILYSNTAKMMFDRSLAWRLSLIAEGDGTLEQRDRQTPQTVLGNRTKIVEVTVWDKGYGHSLLPGKGGVIFKEDSEPLWSEKADPRYDDFLRSMYKRVEDYGRKVKSEFTDLWNEWLLNSTQEFMQLVDWKQRAEELELKALQKPNQIIYPVQPSQSKLHTADALDRIDLFLEQQMDQFQLSGPRYVQTYRIEKPAFQGHLNNIHYRADTYDTSMALIYFLIRGNMQRAVDLGDGLVQAMNHDPIGGGRIVAATIADRLIDPAKNYATSIYVPDGGRRDIGNMSWAGIALTRLYAKTQKHRYLHAAETIGQWVLGNCRVSDSWGGFSGGEDHWGSKYQWRSVEHNVDCVSLFDNLFQLTQKAEWAAARESARTLVKACFINDNYYITGTGIGQVLNKTVLPTDTQSWTSLAKVDPSTEARSLMMMVTANETTSKGFVGTKFAAAGSEVQNEATAGAAMALWLARHQSSSFEATALKYIDSLKAQITAAQNAIGYGIVATPADVADTGEGLGWQYFNLLHVASSAWTGLALLALDNENANPYAAIAKMS